MYTRKPYAQQNSRCQPTIPLVTQKLASGQRRKSIVVEGGSIASIHPPLRQSIFGPLSR